MTAHSILSGAVRREALDEPQRRGVGVSVRAPVLEIGRLDDQRVAFPVAARVAHVQADALPTCGRPSSGITRVSWIIS